MEQQVIELNTALIDQLVEDRDLGHDSPAAELLMQSCVAEIAKFQLTNYERNTLIAGHQSNLDDMQNRLDRIARREFPGGLEHELPTDRVQEGALEPAKEEDEDDSDFDTPRTDAAPSTDTAAAIGHANIREAAAEAAENLVGIGDEPSGPSTLLTSKQDEPPEPMDTAPPADDTTESLAPDLSLIHI